MNELKTNAKFGVVMMLLMALYFGQETIGIDEAYKIWAGVSMSFVVTIWSVRSIVSYLTGMIKEYKRKKELENKERIRKEKEEEEKKRKEKEVKRVVKKVKSNEEES